MDWAKQRSSARQDSPQLFRPETLGLVRAANLDLLLEPVADLRHLRARVDPRLDGAHAVAVGHVLGQLLGLGALFAVHGRGGRDEQDEDG